MLVGPSWNPWILPLSEISPFSSCIFNLNVSFLKSCTWCLVGGCSVHAADDRVKVSAHRISRSQYSGQSEPWDLCSQGFILYRIIWVFWDVIIINIQHCKIRYWQKIRKNYEVPFKVSWVSVLTIPCQRERIIFHLRSQIHFFIQFTSSIFLSFHLLKSFSY